MAKRMKPSLGFDQCRWRGGKDNAACANGQTDNASFDSAYTCSIPERAFPPGITLYAQGVVIDLPAIDSTPVRDFVLDVTVPE